MSIVIKGMKMPQSCSDCQLNLEQKACSVTGTRWWSDTMVLMDFDCDDERLYDCPLVELPEHHGRLIDADYLKEHLYVCATNGRPLHNMYQDLNELLEAIDDIPTVVEAE